MAEIITVGTIASSFLQIQTLVQDLRRYVKGVLRKKKECDDFVKFIEEIERTLLKQRKLLEDATNDATNNKNDVMKRMKILLHELAMARKLVKRLANPIKCMLPATEKLEARKLKINETIGLMTFHQTFREETKSDAPLSPTVGQEIECGLDPGVSSSAYPLQAFVGDGSYTEYYEVIYGR
ncbi:hypothetical protein Mapa_009753 [Marchantia paleacea]|nr:hypothetical protein Mapa_009753 [Marchantia paleacea]